MREGGKGESAEKATMEGTLLHPRHPIPPPPPMSALNGCCRGGSFLFTFSVPAAYPHDPPKVKCSTKVFHPNIDLEGNVCLNILREDWKPVLTVTSIVYGLNFLLLVSLHALLEVQLAGSAFWRCYGGGIGGGRSPCACLMVPATIILVAERRRGRAMSCERHAAHLTLLRPLCCRRPIPTTP